MLETVSRGVSFRDVQRQPQAYRGQTLALGGIVMQLEAIPEGVLVAVREFPLDGEARHRPATDQPSRGYFLLRILRAERPDGLRAGAEITVVGEVIGSGSLPVAGGGEEVPLLVERHLRVWGPPWWPRFQIGIGGSISL